MEAATITPAAKPDRALCKRSLMAFFKKNTQAEPETVPKKGRNIPCKSCNVMDFPAFPINICMKAISVPEKTIHEDEILISKC